MDRLANPFAPAAGESDPGSPPFVFFLPAMAKATAPDDASAVRHGRPAHCPSTSQRVQILVFLLGMTLGWSGSPARRMARQGGQQRSTSPRTSRVRPEVMPRRPSVPATLGE
jgi:hypothetical protein